MDAKTDPQHLDDEPDGMEMNALISRLMRGVNGQAFRLLGDKVAAGPFCGMVIPARTSWDDGNAGTKLMGWYEHELHDAIEHAVWRRPSVIINVGCAEGYYAIGFARRLRIPVFAFDTSEAALKTCQEYAAKNSAEVNLILGATAPEELRLSHLGSGHRFYLIDCEGAELNLINLKLCPELICSDVLVECHDFFNPSISRTIADRMSATHRVELIWPSLPDFGQFPFLRRFPSILSVMLVTEKRPMPCCWLMCWANRRGD